MTAITEVLGIETSTYDKIITNSTKIVYIVYNNWHITKRRVDF